MTTTMTTSILRIITLIILSGVVVSCVDSIPHRATISPGSSKGDDDKDGDGEIVRPTNAIKFKTDFCGCKDNKAITYGSCATFCASKSTAGIETFYANFKVTEAISLSGFGSVHGWCSAAIEGDAQNPKCMIEAKDDEGTKKYLEVTPIAGTNSVTANMDPLSDDKTYVLTLVETVSGAKSDSIQIIKFSADISLGTLGPIKNAPVSQYACLVRSFSADSVTGDIFYDSAYRLHFYFLPRIGVTPIPGGQTDLICHDIYTYGNTDDASFPRLEETPGVFNLWDTLDPRFYDNDQDINKVPDINQIIAQKVKNFGGGTVSTKTTYFNEFKWPGSPTLSEDAGGTSSAQAIGYYMAPWIDQTTFKSYCLTSTQYNGTNPLFKAFRDVISVDTEGLYVGEKAAETVTASDGTVTSGFKDYILLRETDIKAVWFYLNGGVHTAPTDANVKDVAVYFYYPINKTTPFVKTSTQRMYKVKWAYELSGATTPTTLPPHDRKIGCIPKF